MPRKGLGSSLQQFYAGPSRHLPAADVTVTMSGAETGTDVALFLTNVYDSVDPIPSLEGAKVSIVEVPVGGPALTSIRED